MARPQRVAVLASGGLDSAALLAHYHEQRYQVTPIYIRQGLQWETVELFWLKKFLRRVRGLEPLQLLSLPMHDVYGKHWSVGQGPVPGARSRDQAVYLPGRNLLLSIKPAVFCAMQRIPRLAIGSLGHNPFRDARPAFFRQWSRALSVGLGARLLLEAPFRRLSKSDVIARYAHWPLSFSFSCLAPRGKHHCGRCNKCAERKAAFRKAGVKDRTLYA